MHRYRDAILELQKRSDGSTVQRRTVVEAAAVFPGGETEDSFYDSRLWKALEQIGVGALPFLPANKEYVREWLRSRLKMGEFSILEHTIPHSIYEQAHGLAFLCRNP